MRRAAHHSVGPLLGVLGLLGLFVSYRISQLSVTLAGVNWAPALVVAGIMAGLYLMGLALYLLMRRHQFMNHLNSVPMILALIAAFIILVQIAAYVATEIIIYELTLVSL